MLVNTEWLSLMQNDWMVNIWFYVKTLRLRMDCKIRLTLVNLNSDSLLYWPYMIKINKCSENGDLFKGQDCFLKVA